MQWIVGNQGENLTQGTILYGVDFGYGEYNPLCIVLSNACDFENDKLSFIILAILVPAKETLRNSKEVCAIYKEKEWADLTRREKDAICNIYTDKIHNKSIGRYYFFNPKPIIDMDPLLVDFQHVRSFEYSTFKKSVDNGKIQVLGRLDHPFVEQMMMQYAGYTGRVPSDRLSSEKVQELINTLL